ncbi:DNRLRE domain-containing protein [candidate division KSB1 bacterium]|nr:DNRLRE domain-containing protein [candidate division KSB1 bacterium]NIR72553.1 DNRLRE domain-containing protein [candidate division KSB1 bacterium]NIS27305.1 DNRLRE domain-containing protein [candidate division KSB1 bacterium]NIT73515.1 DNRLRE domain-containing protein [candidate division KSB1 bacterium]NIU28035.1 DNRLRE domain-containing protein [candidate division KSB1 bacterium]
MRLDVSHIPQDAAIQSATLKLYFYGAYGTNKVTRTIQCHQVLKYWYQSVATWRKRLSGVYWGTYGVGLDDIDAKSTPEDSQDWYDDYPIWKNYDITALTQKWVNGTADNDGVIPKSRDKFFWATNEDDYTDGDEKWVYSSEYSDASKRPKLVVTYTVDPIAENQYDALVRPSYHRDLCQRRHRNQPV